MRALRAGVAIAALSVAAGCYKAPPETIVLDGNTVHAFNRTPQKWSHVEIWVNRYFRVTSEDIPPGGRFDAPLDAFVGGFGRRFNYRQLQITDVRLKATLPDGKPLEVKKDFFVGGLAGAFGGGKR